MVYYYLVTNNRNNKMKKLITALLIIVSASASAAFLKYSYVSGMNRVCVYDDLGSKLVITVKNYEMCPLSI